MPVHGQSGNRFVSTPEYRSYSSVPVKKDTSPPKPPAVTVESDAPLVRVLLVDPRPLTAEAVCTCLESAARSSGVARFHVVAATAGREIPVEEHFDLLLIHNSLSTDISEEIERCLGTIPVAYRHLPTVVYSDCCGTAEIAAAMRSGARGYLPSTLDSDSIVEALRLLASGLAVFPPEVLSTLAGCRIANENGEQQQQGVPTGTAFTSREREVLERLHAGKPNKAIARELGVSQSTVKVHVRSVFSKLGVHNRTEAAIVSGEYLLAHPTS